MFVPDIRGCSAYWRRITCMKVLIADDHSLIRSAMKVLMESQGYDVVAEAANGTDTVNWRVCIRWT